MITPAARDAALLLRQADLSSEDRQLLTAVLLDRLGALPARAKIATDAAGRILIDGKALTLPTAVRVRRSAKALQNNFAYKLIQETLDFLAVEAGVHHNTSPEQGLFAKAILWQHQEERELLRRLAGDGFEDEGRAL